MLEEDYPLSCPYCFARISVRIDLSGGNRQRFTEDCEVCCRPILIDAEVEEHEVISFSAERES